MAGETAARVCLRIESGGSEKRMDLLEQKNLGELGALGEVGEKSSLKA